MRETIRFLKARLKAEEKSLDDANARLTKIAELLEWPDDTSKHNSLGDAANEALEIARGERAP